MSELLGALNEKQREAVSCTEGPLLILAGAGSGKTRVLTYRTAHLVQDCGVAPWHILAVTFTNKAAGEMKERIQGLVGHGSGEIWVATFHSTCVRILRRFIDRIGLDDHFSIYDTDDSKAVIREVLRRLSMDPKQVKEKTFLRAISSAKDKLIGPAEFEEDAQDEAEKLTAQIYREYQKILRQNNALDFDDLIYCTVELFRKDPEVLDYYQEKFRYIMVDEFQDTNFAQLELVRLLGAKYGNVCVVGDDDQSIYRFRGADIRNIMNFETYFPNARQVKLEQNYRSTQTILDAANAVIAHNTERHPKRLWTENGQGEKILFRRFVWAPDESAFVVQDIQERVKDHGEKHSDHAILYRTNAQSRLFEERLVNAGIPYQLVGGINFYGRQEIKDVLAYLKTVENATDDLAVRRIVNVPRRGIGATTVSRVDAFAQEQGISFFDALARVEEVSGVNSKTNDRIREFRELILRLRGEVQDLTIAEAIQRVLQETGYQAELEKEHTEEAEERLENIDELVSKAVTYAQEFTPQDDRDKPTLSEFLEEVALVADIDDVEEEKDRVILMTLHSAKGLEFPTVYLTGMEDGLFPGIHAVRKDSPNPHELEEERRLCYVGITRARNRLVLTGARERMVRGESHHHPVSRFIKEIPPELLSDEPQEERVPERVAFAAFQSAKKSFETVPYAAAPKPRSFPGRDTERSDLSYGPGDRVKHIKFGEGTVQSIVEGGKDFEVTVAFDKVGVKKMFASFAKLQAL